MENNLISAIQTNWYSFVVSVFVFGFLFFLSKKRVSFGNRVLIGMGIGLLIGILFQQLDSFEIKVDNEGSNNPIEAIANNDATDNAAALQNEAEVETKEIEAVEQEVKGTEEASTVSNADSKNIASSAVEPATGNSSQQPETGKATGEVKTVSQQPAVADAPVAKSSTVGKAPEAVKVAEASKAPEATKVPEATKAPEAAGSPMDVPFDAAL